MGLGDQRHDPVALPPGMTRYPLYRRLGRPQGRSGRVMKISPPPGFDPRTVQLVASHYTDWAIADHHSVPVLYKRYVTVLWIVCDHEVTAVNTWQSEPTQCACVMQHQSHFHWRCCVLLKLIVCLRIWTTETLELASIGSRRRTAVIWEAYNYSRTSVIRNKGGGPDFG
jgi:hypothetical protein